MTSKTVKSDIYIDDYVANIHVFNVDEETRLLSQRYRTTFRSVKSDVYIYDCDSGNQVHDVEGRH